MFSHQAYPSPQLHGKCLEAHSSLYPLYPVYVNMRANALPLDLESGEEWDGST